MTKPDWKQGDLIAIPSDLSQSYAIYRGCHVFVATENPRLVDGKWLYGYRDCREIRRATVEDIDRLIRVTSEAIIKESDYCRRLLSLREKFFENRNGGDK